MVDWLKYYTNLSYNLNEQFNYEPTEKFPQGSVQINIHMDDATYGKVMKFIEG